MLYFMYIRVQNYDANMKLNFQMVEQTNILLQYSLAKLCIVFWPTFLFPWRRPCDYHPIFPIDEKTIQCLPNILQHVPIYLQQFPSYSNCKCKKLAVFAYRSPHFFVSSRDVPATTTLYFPQMKRELDGCQTSRSMYLSILNTFRVI